MQAHRSMGMVLRVMLSASEAADVLDLSKRWILQMLKKRELARYVAPNLAAPSSPQCQLLHRFKRSVRCPNLCVIDP
jgi:hypothetical protein